MSCKLILGDCLEQMRELPPGSIDALVTDKPYCSGGHSAAERLAPPSKKYEQSSQKLRRPEFQGDHRDQFGFMAWCSLWLALARTAAKPGAMAVVFTDWRQLPITCASLQAGGWVHRGIAVWDKTEGCRPQMGRFRSQCEFAVWGTNGHPTRELATSIGVLPGAMREPVRQADKYHMAGKPTPVMSWLVKCCPPGGTVLDPFAGSGTTGVAAIKAGLNFVGFEIDPTYHAIAERRLLEAEHD